MASVATAHRQNEATAARLCLRVAAEELAVLTRKARMGAAVSSPISPS